MVESNHLAELRRLAIMLNHLDSTGIAVLICEDDKLRAELMSALEERVQRPAFRLSLAPGQASPLSQMKAHNIGQGDVVQFFDFPEYLDLPGANELISQLEFERETLWETDVKFVFWLTGASKRLLLHYAPNFYSRRTLLISFTKTTSELITVLVAQPIGLDLEGAILTDFIHQWHDALIDHIKQSSARITITIPRNIARTSFAAICMLPDDALKLALEWPDAEHLLARPYSHLTWRFAIHTIFISSEEKMNNHPELVEEAERLASWGGANSILLTEASRSALRNPPQEIGFFAHGPRRLRRSDAPQAIYEVTTETHGPVALKWSKVVNNLPLRRRFIGREEELAVIASTLNKQGTVVIQGEPGIGKSALALESAHSARGARRFPGGVAWIDLTQSSDVSSVRANLGEVFQVPPPHPTVYNTEIYPEKSSLVAQEWDQQLRAHWKSAHCIVVLDGADNWIDSFGSGRELQEWVRQWSDEVALIITQRSTDLNTKRWDSDAEVILSPLDPNESRALFLSTIRKHWHGNFNARLYESQIQSFIDYCEGYPITIELYGTYAAQSRFQHQVDFKQSRHLTDGAVVLSELFRTIDTDTRQFLAAAGLFEGTFTLEALQSVFGAETEKWLRQAQESGYIDLIGGQNERFQLQPIIRALVMQSEADVIEKVGEKKKWRIRFVKHYQQEAEIAQFPSTETGLFREFEAAEWSQEWPNFRGALHYALDLKYKAAIQTIFPPLANFLVESGRWNEAIEVCDLIALDSEPNIVAQQYSFRAMALSELGLFEEALTYNQKALHIFRSLHQINNQGRILNNIANLYAALGRWEEARSAAEQDVAICEAQSNRFGSAIARANLSTIWARSGELEKAGQELKIVLQQLYTLESDEQIPTFAIQSAIARFKVNQGNISRELKRYEEAANNYKEVINLANRIGEWEQVGTAAFNMASMEEDQDHLQEAIHWYQVALNAFNQVEFPESVAAHRERAQQRKSHIESLISER